MSGEHLLPMLLRGDPFCAGRTLRSERVYFRKRIGAKGIELIFRESVRLNGEDVKEESIKADTAAQGKNIMFPTDAKLRRKIIKKCQAISKKEGLPVRQSYTRTLKDLGMQRFRRRPKNKGKTKKADRKAKTIAGRLVREYREEPFNDKTLNKYQQRKLRKHFRRR